MVKEFEVLEDCRVNDKIADIPQKLLLRLLEKLRLQKKMNFAEFMQEALYAPWLGYYNNGKQKFGQHGDFITAPELGSLFAKSVAYYCMQLITQDGLPKKILEFGAGSGKLAHDILFELNRFGIFVEYSILDVSPSLRDFQQENLSGKSDKCDKSDKYDTCDKSDKYDTCDKFDKYDTRDKSDKLDQYEKQLVWIDSFPDNFDGIVIANEVLDAMPFHRFVLIGEYEKYKIYEYYITENNAKLIPESNSKLIPGGNSKLIPESNSKLITGSNSKLILELGEASLEVENKVRQMTFEAFQETYYKLPNWEYTSEVSLLYQPWLKSLANCLSDNSRILIFDYGLLETEYYHPERSDGTMRCHYLHSAHSDALQNLGLQDITAHVNFSELINYSVNCDLEVMEYTTLSKFLFKCNILEIYSDLIATRSVDANFVYKLKQELLCLLSEVNMGEIFKCLIFRKK